MNQQKPHNILRIPAIGSPIEVANNSSREPQTLNYVDCYPVKEDQFGDKPIYQVAMREAFKQLSTYDIGTITTAGTPYNSALAASPPANLSGYIISQIGQLLVVNEDSSGTALFINVLMTKQANTTPYNTVIVSLEIDIGGTSGTVINAVKPLYLFFGAPSLGCSTMGTFNVPAGGPTITSNDPYYITLGALPVVNLTISSNQLSGYNIYTSAGSPTVATQVNLTINGGVYVGPLLTGTGWATGSIININNAGNILGLGGAPTTNVANIGGLHPYEIYAAIGGNGGPALYLNWNVSITNTGTIGGGGGAGGSAGFRGSGPYYGPGGSGYGAGINSGAIGAAPTTLLGSSIANLGSASTASTFTTGGTGGISSNPAPETSTGGAGGAAYVAGSSGSNNQQTAPNYGAPWPNAGSGGGGLGAAGGGTSSNVRGAVNIGGLPGNAVQCNGYSVLNIPNGTYTGAGTYGTIYGVIG